MRSQGRGELLVSLCHQPAANRLTAVVLKARNLPKMDITGLSGQLLTAGILCSQFEDCCKILLKKAFCIRLVVRAVTSRTQPRGQRALSVQLGVTLFVLDRIPQNDEEHREGQQCKVKVEHSGWLLAEINEHEQFRYTNYEPERQ